MRKKVFISSTFRDLKHHREEIWKRIQDLEVDVLGMEYFGARKSTPIETCLEEVDNCNIYIGIISMVAGTIHSELNKSFTELEYERAISQNKDIWIYLIDENDGQIKSGNIDFGEKHEYLSAFKKRLKEKHTVDFFKSEEELADKIFTRLNEILVKKRENKIVRPSILDCNIGKFKSPNHQWVVFVGYLDKKPFEIFSGLSDDDFGVLLPSTITEGKIVKSKTPNDYFRYDFQYTNKHGYRTTIEGINYPYIPEISANDRLISSLLQNGIEIEIVVDAIREFHSGNKDHEVWKEKILEILINK